MEIIERFRIGLFSLTRWEIIGITGGLTGAFFVSQGEPLAANVIWLCANPFLIYHNLQKNDLGQAFMFTVYVLLAMIGVNNLWF